MTTRLLPERRWRTRVERWCTLWEVPELAADVRVTINSRLSRTVGHCRPSDGTITLAESVIDASRRDFEAVLCHELAHLAAHRRFGPRIRPHGPEWARLVEQAGFTAEVRTCRGPATLQRRRAHTGRLPYRHFCPVCHFVRFARRPVTRWRCADCVAAGLDGELLIEGPGVRSHAVDV